MAALDHVSALVERLGGVNNVAFLQETEPENWKGDGNTPIQDDRMETSRQ